MAYTTHPCSGLPRRRSYATSRKLPQDAVRCCVPTRRSRTVARNWILVQPREVSSSHFVHLHINDDRAKHIAGVLDAKLGSEVRVSVLHRGLFLGEVISISGMPSVTTAGGALGGNPRRNSTGTGPVSDSLHTRGEANEGAAPGTAAAEGLAIRISERSERQPAAPRIDLLLAMPRPKVLSRLWAPLCTLGVRQIVVCGATKVERKYWSSRAFEADSVQAELIRGLEQAGDFRMPRVVVTKSLACGMRLSSGSTRGTWGWEVVTEGTAFQEAGPGAGRGEGGDVLSVPGKEQEADGVVKRILILAHPPRALDGSLSETADSGRSVRQCVKEALQELPEDLRRNASVTLAIGPEGGWTEEEVEAFEAAGWRMGGIGTRVLTTETACLTAVALCQDAINDAA